MVTGRARCWSLALVVCGIAGVLLYPFRLAPPNAVRWLPAEPGLHFGGEGIAHGEAEIRKAGSGEPLDAISLELWLQVPPKSPNWGTREIFSLYDGRPSPPILLGAYGNRLFLFSRFEPGGPGEWFRQFLPMLQLQPGRTHFVAATASPDEWLMLRDGVVVMRRPSIAHEPLRFSGRPVLGNAPSGRRGWWGEVRGLAIYDAALPEATIAGHGTRVAEAGLGALAREPGLVALYAFSEGGGRRVADAIRPDGALALPERFAALPRSMLRRPRDDVPGRLPFWQDPLQNVLLFLPLGALLGGPFARRVALGLALSLGLETLQLLIPSRTASSLDVAWNTLGTALGAALSRGMARRRRR